ncbi:RNA polymerase sigma factor [Persicitalea jodogahamensis]|uniref:DNA-directed RNA polymerase sigma-70 factor n=1 Tax=Persicitalea jodogahamensis TaxID=402147 RepID=A0A8J3DBF9_9BACT|nr:sigma-70 family RNA polymerase sigma factor [Persicitalea jodogahamensis]GHB80011.1 DNA-directed RNA polymerase sigma-70 factor [Persicitalea jodogahamensis]
MSGRLSTEEAQRLWRDFRSGDIEALATLMERFYPDLFNWGMRMHSEREFVKDCIQDIFLSLWKMQETIASVENVRSYLLVVLKSRILRELSKKENKLYNSLTEEYAFSVEFSADLRLIEEEHEVYQLRKLEQVMNQLPPRQKELIYLRFHQNLSFEQIAEVMQLGRQSVYNLLQKSLGTLRKHWVTAMLGILCWQGIF